MQVFKDDYDRNWKIELNISTVRQLRQRAATVDAFKDVDFLDYSILLTKINDPFFAADLLWLVCEEQAKPIGVNSEDFGKLLKGRILFDATAAFLAEYVNFFPEPTIARKIKAIVEKTNEAREKLADAICQTTLRLLNESLDDAATQLGALSSNASRSPEGR